MRKVGDDKYEATDGSFTTSAEKVAILASKPGEAPQTIRKLPPEKATGKNKMGLTDSKSFNKKFHSIQKSVSNPSERKPEMEKLIKTAPEGSNFSCKARGDTYQFKYLGGTRVTMSKNYGVPYKSDIDDAASTLAIATECKFDPFH